MWKTWDKIPTSVFGQKHSYHMIIVCIDTYPSITSAGLIPGQSVQLQIGFSKHVMGYNDVCWSTKRMVLQPLSQTCPAKNEVLANTDILSDKKNITTLKAVCSVRPQ